MAQVLQDGSLRFFHLLQLQAVQFLHHRLTYFHTTQARSIVEIIIILKIPTLQSIIIPPICYLIVLWRGRADYVMIQTLQQQRMQDYRYLFKIVVIGDPGVGKTNLVSQFVEEKFVEDQKPTVGVEFSSKNIVINEKAIRCQIWDTAGQERFRAVTKAYYNGAAGAIVVFDLTSSLSFQNTTRWIHEAEQNTKKSTVILLIGNKSDLSKRQVSMSKIQLLLSEYKGIILYMQTSAKTGNNVQKAFKKIIEEIFNEKLKQIQVKKKEESIRSTNKEIQLPEPSKNIILKSKSSELSLKHKTSFNNNSNSTNKKKKECC